MTTRINLCAWFVTFCILGAGAAPADAGTIYVEGGQTVVFDGVSEQIDDYYILGYTTGRNTLHMLNEAEVHSASHLVLGYHVSSDGNSMSVSGGSSWMLDSSMTVGSNGDHNLLSIADGGCVQAGGLGYVGLGVAADNNTVEVEGAGSAWLLTDGLYVGGFADGRQFGYYNTVSVADGGWIRAAQIRTYGSNTLSVSNATLQTVGGTPLDLRGVEQFSGVNTLVLEFDALADMRNGAFTLATGLDAPALIDTFNVVFHDSEGTLYRPDDATFTCTAGVWRINSGEAFTVVPEPSTAALAALGAFAVRRRRSSGEKRR